MSLVERRTKKTTGITVKASNNNMAKASDSVVAPEEDKEGGNQLILREIRELRAELLQKIDQNSEKQANEIRLLKDEFTTLLNQAGNRTSSLEGKVSTVEQTLSGHSDDITALIADVAMLKKEVISLDERNQDLEARSRRGNLRITGVRERREHGKRVSEFVSQLLKDSLGLETAPRLDRAHRTLRERPEAGQPPRAFVVRFHYPEERDDILQKAIEKQRITTPDGDKIRLQPNYTPKVAKQRSAFNDVRKKLRELQDEGKLEDGVRFGLFHPAELRITGADGKRNSFTDATE